MQHYSYPITQLDANYCCTIRTTLFDLLDMRRRSNVYTDLKVAPRFMIQTPFMLKSFGINPSTTLPNIDQICYLCAMQWTLFDRVPNKVFCHILVVNSKHQIILILQNSSTLLVLYCHLIVPVNKTNAFLHQCNTGVFFLCSQLKHCPQQIGVSTNFHIKEDFNFQKNKKMPVSFLYYHQVCISACFNYLLIQQSNCHICLVKYNVQEELNL